jgi:hypothetical protein
MERDGAEISVGDERNFGSVAVIFDIVATVDVLDDGIVEFVALLVVLFVTFSIQPAIIIDASTTAVISMVKNCFIIYVASIVETTKNVALFVLYYTDLIYVFNRPTAALKFYFLELFSLQNFPTDHLRTCNCTG